MAECPCLAGCPFFNDRMADMPVMANSMKRRFCEGEFTTCARFMIFSKLGKEKVPADLFPNDVEKAGQILAT